MCDNNESNMCITMWRFQSAFIHIGNSCRACTMNEALCWVLVGGTRLERTMRASLHGAVVLLEETEDMMPYHRLGWEAVKSHYSHFTDEETKAD